MLFIFDMDGVLWRGNEPVPYAAEAVATLRRAGHTIRFFTNNSARSREAYVPRLGHMGIVTTEDEVITSAYALALFFEAEGMHGACVYVVGEDGVRHELRTVAGCRIFEDDAETADAVVVGIDRQFTYAKMRTAQQHLLRGAHFLCTNRDTTFPVENGGLVPGAGSIVAGIAAAAGREPVNVGKPNAYGVELVARMAGVPLAETVVIGDRLDTDIAAGCGAGARTLLVLTGVTSQAQADAAEPPMRPDMVLPDLSRLPLEWTAA